MNKAYSTGHTPVWTLDTNQQPKLVVIAKDNEFLGEIKSVSKDPLWVKYNNDSKQFQLASANEPGAVNFGYVVILNYDNKLRLLSTIAPANFKLNGTQVTRFKEVGNSAPVSDRTTPDTTPTPTDTTKDTKESGTKIKPIAIVGGIGVLLGVYLLLSK